MKYQPACQLLSPENPEKFILSFSGYSQPVFPIEMLEHDTAYIVYLFRKCSFWLLLSCSTGPNGELLKGTSVNVWLVTLRIHMNLAFQAIMGGDVAGKVQNSGRL